MNETIKNEPLTPLAKGFYDGLMSAELPEEDNEVALTQAVYAALREYYATIECDPRFLAIHIIENI